MEFQYDLVPIGRSSKKSRHYQKPEASKKRQRQKPEPIAIDDEVRAAIVKQIEWYLSPDNLEKDFFLRGFMDMEGYIPVSLFLSFPRIQTIVTDYFVLFECIKAANVDVDEYNEKIRPKEDWKQWLVEHASGTLGAPLWYRSNERLYDVLSHGVAEEEVLPAEEGEHKQQQLRADAPAFVPGK